MTQYLAFDIGGTNLKYALLDASGKIIKKDSVETPTKGLKYFIEILCRIVDKYQGSFSGIALSTPGNVSPKDNIIRFGGSLPFLDGFNAKIFLEQRYQVPVSIINDGKAAALAESWLGQLKDVKNGVVLTLGTAVGGGIILNGQLFFGQHFQAGEVSFVKDQKELPGLDGFAARNGSAVLMIKAINKSLGNKNLNDGKQAFAAIKAGDQNAIRIFESYCRDVATLCLNLQAILDLQKIVISGGISAQPILVRNIRNQFKKVIGENKDLNQIIYHPEIVEAKFKNDANLYGALYFLLLQTDQYFEGGN